ncbi:MAG TPA: hypothetical protein VL993_19605 [Stellaceae bacterium]|nr:hypothetical protein [Stellaceae bacterium]
MTVSTDRPRAGFFLALIAVALSGCLRQPRLDEARAKANAAFAACDAARAEGRLRTYRAAVECAVPTVTQAYSEAAYAFPDLLYVRIEARRFGAGKVDEGEITAAQYDHDVAELDKRIRAEEERRTEIAERSGTPTPVPEETLIAGLPSFASPTGAAPAPPGACQPLGEIRTCK